MKLEHKLAAIGGNLLAPGFAQALAGRRNAALVWLGLATATAALATVTVWVAIAAVLVHLAAVIGAVVELRRIPASPVWWTRLSLMVFVLGIAGIAFLEVTGETYRIPSSSMYPTLAIGDRIFVDKLSPRWRPPERGEVIVFRYPCDRDRDYVKRVIAIGGDTVEVRCNVVYVNGEAIASELVTARDEYRDHDEMGGMSFLRPCSRYREYLGGHTYEVFHDPERPARDRERGTPTTGDARDFPRRDLMIAPSCQRSELHGPKPGAPQPAGRLVVTKHDAKPCEQQAHFVVPPGALFVIGDNRNNAHDSRVWGALSVEDVIGRVIGIWSSSPPGSGESCTGADWSRVGDLE